ncbi:uncharacterized protein LOC143919594 isoform X2 [Arctopsyche grandis]|uniref:uncharacterized protein LOC143919594 isoform X2 n=1 Tax=Arctopsyche grandis TaxID=121162 RepID=UPI00406D72E5
MLFLIYSVVRWSADFVFAQLQPNLSSPSMTTLIHWPNASGPIVDEYDGLPDSICLSCESKLELFSIFRNCCLQSDETSKLRLGERLDIKTKEIFLQDLIWKDDESVVNSPPNIYSDTPVNNESNEWKSCATEQSDSKPNILLIENINAPIHGGTISCDCKAGIPLEDSPLRKTSTHSETRVRQKNRTPFECEICSKTFTYKSTFDRHLTTHTGEKAFKCDICSKSFALKRNLAAHIESHLGIKSHKCDICLKTFVLKSYLTAHMKSHTGFKPHKCDICFKSFVKKCFLVKHEKSHTGDKPYKCDICLRSFIHKSSYVKHMKSHTEIKPYKCNICLKSFTSESNLATHEKYHTGEKSYKCSICFKLFNWKHNLSVHMKSHTGIKPHKCKICLKSFTRKSNLAIHEKYHAS